MLPTGRAQGISLFFFTTKCLHLHRETHNICTQLSKSRLCSPRYTMSALTGLFPFPKPGPQTGGAPKSDLVITIVMLLLILPLVVVGLRYGGATVNSILPTYSHCNRLYVRLRIVKIFGRDDFFIVIAMVSKPSATYLVLTEIFDLIQHVYNWFAALCDCVVHLRLFRSKAG
jgi:hypothetical protein